MFLPGISVGMVVALNVFPPAPPWVGSLLAEPAEVNAGGQIELIAYDVRRSRDDLVWEGLDGSLRVIFYQDRNRNGLPDVDEVVGDGDFGLLRGKRNACCFDTQSLPPGNYVCLARAAVGGRASNVASVTIKVH